MNYDCNFFVRDKSCANCSFFNKNPGLWDVCRTQTPTLTPNLHCHSHSDRIALYYILTMVCDDANFRFFYCIISKSVLLNTSFIFLSTRLEFERVLSFEESIHESKFTRY